MSAHHGTCVGIDVSQDRLDVVVLPEAGFFSVSNDAAGMADTQVITDMARAADTQYQRLLLTIRVRQDHAPQLGVASPSPPRPLASPPRMSGSSS